MRDDGRSGSFATEAAKSAARPTSASALGRVKTKSDLVVMPSGRQIFAVFFALRMTVEPKIPGAIIPRSVFTQPGPKADVRP
jgi:hypothetical protein